MFATLLIFKTNAQLRIVKHIFPSADQQTRVHCVRNTVSVSFSLTHFNVSWLKPILKFSPNVMRCLRRTAQTGPAIDRGVQRDIGLDWRQLETWRSLFSFRHLRQGFAPTQGWHHQLPAFGWGSRRWHWSTSENKQEVSSWHRLLLTREPCQAVASTHWNNGRRRVNEI